MLISPPPLKLLVHSFYPLQIVVDDFTLYNFVPFFTPYNFWPVLPPTIFTIKNVDPLHKLVRISDLPTKNTIPPTHVLLE